MTTDARPFIPDTTAFGARLALIRWHMGWNQKEAALACQLPAGSWREWELSGRAPRNLVEIAGKIHDATGIDDFWIMTGRVTPGSGPNGGGHRVTRALLAQQATVVTLRDQSGWLLAPNRTSQRLAA